MRVAIVVRSTQPARDPELTPAIPSQGGDLTTGDPPLLAAAAAFVGLALAVPAHAQKPVEFRYGHMNPPNSAAGMQAQWFADGLAKATAGQIKVTVYPSSQLGKLQELAEAVSTGTIALSHNTAGGIGSLYEPFGALDTPYLYRDVDHLMKVMDINSPVMKKLNDGLVKAAGVRVLYAYYFGTRQLTANKAVLQPSDLSGQKIRAIPFPIYMATVQGLGAVPVPVDWSEVPAALATGQVAGQENPVNVVLSSQALRDAVAPDADRSHHERAGDRHEREVLAGSRAAQRDRDHQGRGRSARPRRPRWCAGPGGRRDREAKSLKMTVIGTQNGSSSMRSRPR